MSSALNRSRRFVSETNLTIPVHVAAAPAHSPIAEHPHGHIDAWPAEDSGPQQRSPSASTDFRSASSGQPRPYSDGNYLCGVTPRSQQSDCSRQSRRSRQNRRRPVSGSRPQSMPARRGSRCTDGSSSAAPSTEDVAAAILESVQRQSGSLSEGSGGDARMAGRRAASGFSSIAGATMDSDTIGLPEDTLEGARPGAGLVGQRSLAQRGVLGDMVEEAGITLSIGGINALDFPSGATRGASSSASIGSLGSGQLSGEGAGAGGVMVSGPGRGGGVAARGRGRRSMRTVAETRMQALDRVMQARPRSAGRPPNSVAGPPAVWSDDRALSRHGAPKSPNAGKSSGLHDTLSSSSASASLQLPPRPSTRLVSRGAGASPTRRSDSTRMARVVSSVSGVSGASGASVRTATSASAGQHGSPRNSPRGSPKASPRKRGSSGRTGSPDARPGRVWRASTAVLERGSAAATAGVAVTDPTQSFEFPMPELQQPDTDRLLGELSREADSGERGYSGDRTYESMQSDGLPPTPSRFHSATSDLTPSIHTSGIMDSSLSESSLEGDRRR